MFCILFQRYFSDDSKVPVLIVGNKADMTAVRQDYILQPEAFCAKHRVITYMLNINLFLTKRANNLS